MEGVNMDQVHKKNPDQEDSSVLRPQTSMGTLITWNISKAIEVNPNINLKSAIKETQERLESDGRDVSALVSQSSEERYLACALLAWQQLGHKETDSLYQFVESRQNQLKEEDRTPLEECKAIPKRPVLCPGSYISYEEPTLSQGVGSSNYDTCSLVGPVVKLPVETKVIMRIENTPTQRPVRKKNSGLMKKIDAACCMDSACMEKLSQLDKSATELRARAERLARREAERIELLERAEAAWKDLESRYQRRLAMALEKEEDMAKHIKNMIDERNGYKNACNNLAQQIRERTEAAEEQRARLIDIEKDVCENACIRLRLSEEAARIDAALNEQQCKGTQLDRDLQFKEDQIRRKVQILESELDSKRCLTFEVERELHAELNSLRQQIVNVSNELLVEDAENGRIKEEVEELRRAKMEIIEDLDGCKLLCDGKIQVKMDILKAKREQLKELKERVTECQCKLPVDVSVEAKRTPSLAILCKCSPDDRQTESCSCTSLRTSLLLNLLADLFDGLQSELGHSGSQMPCQLLKCLEDRHHWDKPTTVKTNLRNYFSQLLIGELDIAIATSIEKYHARWVGACCADAARMVTNCSGPPSEAWQECAVEERAQKLATKLAEQLFQERADQLTAKAKEIVESNPSPCECKQRPAIVYPVLMKQPMIGGPPGPSPPPHTTRSNGAHMPAYWRRTHQDVTQLKVQLEDLKKDSIRKEDLKEMEENIVKMVQRAAVTDDTPTEPVKENVESVKNKTDDSIHRSVNTDQVIKRTFGPKLSSIKKKQLDLKPKGGDNFILGLQVDRSVKTFKKFERSYAVNMCLCSSQENTKKVFKSVKKSFERSVENDNKNTVKGISNNTSQISSGKNKSINFSKPSKQMSNSKKSKTPAHPLCRSGVLCFHKTPSSTSINNLLGTLAKWQCDLNNLNTDTGSNIQCKKYLDNSILDSNPPKISKNVSALPYRSNQVVMASVSKSVEVPCVPMTSESEYMRTINLDCVGSGNEEPSSEEKSKISNCIHSADCDCKASFNEKKQTNVEISENVNKERLKQEEKCDTQLTQNKVNIDLTQNEDKPVTGIGQMAETPTVDCQYCIKFLGVSLTNANSTKDIPEKDKSPKLKRPISMNTKLRRGNNSNNIWYNKVDTATRKTQLQSPICDCVKKYDEVKTFLNDVIVKQHGDHNEHEDKSMDTQSFQSKLEFEGCICCEDKLNESKELEVNAFHLLEDHLREKLVEFKSSHCKSACISPEVEERLFSTILQRVKQVIFKNTTEITCKCAPEELKEGSWHRAYMLLEEYLKIKIKKVQCLCHSKENISETILPNVLEKVCTLIDDDFKRLKEKCKCNNQIYENNLPGLNHQIDKDVPEKHSGLNKCDENARKIDTISNIHGQLDKVNKEISNNSILVKQNISSQISPNLEMSTKSCNAMESSVYPNKCCQMADINYDGGFCTHSSKITKSYLELFGSNDEIVNQCLNIKKGLTPKNIDIAPTHIANTSLQGSKTQLIDSCSQNSNRNGSIQILAEACTVDKIDLQNKVPYIGYTVDCSCNGVLGTCTCTKSLISGKNDNINSIWNTLTSNKLRRYNNSYIMDAVAKKDLKDIEKVNAEEPNKTEITQSQAKVTRDLKTGVFYSDEITLKYSDEKQNKNFTSATTSGDDICLNHDFNFEPIEWCECNSNMKKMKPNINDINDKFYERSFFPVGNLVNRGKSASIVKSDPIDFPRSISSNCDCNMVPMCHVKMLVENIENKLLHSKCTCDSLCSKICPVHSKKH